MVHGVSSGCCDGDGGFNSLQRRPRVKTDCKYGSQVQQRKGTTKNPLKVFGHVEMDASIMDGSTMQAGAVASVGGVRHPVQLARFPFSLFILND